MDSEEVVMDVFSILFETSDFGNRSTVLLGYKK
jgi:hypothetical protein